MRIVIDAMGGDNAPAVNVEGAVAAARDYKIEVILVGDETAIKRELSKHNTAGLPLSVVHACDVIGMHESPAQACRQKSDSSIMVATRLVKEGKADGLVSAGNSGAVMASSLMLLGRLSGVSRPAIASLIPTASGVSLIIDAGANMDCKPKNLLQFAIMGDVFVKYIFNKTNPVIGLLSIGEESTKGNELTQAAFGLIRDSQLNFIGNIEGRDVSAGEVDVIVCDGFIGNILLKFAEGLAFAIVDILKKELSKSIWNKILLLSGLFAIKRSLKNLNKRIDYAEYGGAPLLGINGVSIIAHGISNARAIKNAIKVAGELVDKKINEHLKAELEMLNGMER
ncbi:MAG: phosphate acyltransferase PlsX [bacterium]